ncbi:Polynucleotidyl transferase ribonuclease H-like superfamily protein [Euphorbia peplus]|nr:Polynucleotidyl transferase ribonuclease H-like superfamily protein [Euphorbia peplus]
MDCYLGHSRSVLFAIVCWWLWRWRNKLVFDSNTSHEVQKINFILKQAKEYGLMLRLMGLRMPKTYAFVHIGWKPPDMGWVKIDCDGASKGNPGLASAGGVI